jgi:hypothetical protein
MPRPVLVALAGLIALLAVFHGEPAVAQVVSVTGKLPVKVEPGLDKTQPSVLLRGLVCWENPEFVLDPRKPEARRPVGELPPRLFLETYIVGEIYTEPREDPILKRPRRWFLLVDTIPNTNPPEVRDGGHLGWLPEEQVAPFATAHGFPEALREKKTPIHRKCMLINTLEEARKAEDLRAQIAFATRPDAAGKATVSRALFTIYYVYQETPTHFFVGDQPVARHADSLLGWVPRKRVCQWNTREAIEFNKEDRRSRPAVLFRKEAEMIEYLKSDTLPSLRDLGPEGSFQPRPLALEALDAPPWKYYQARFPLVSEEGITQGREPVGGYKIYKVGIIGDVYRKDLQGGPLMTNRQLDEARREVEEMRKQAATIQVLLVIDATFGMDDYFKAGHAAVKKIMASLQDLDALGIKPDVQFSVNFYRDRRDEQDGRIPSFDGVPFGSSLDAIERLEKVRALGGGPEYDSVYYGISKALAIDPRQKDLAPGQKTKFTPNAIKILVVVGDDGNDDTDKEYPQERIIKEITSDAGPPINFFAVSVGDQTKPRFKALTTQMAELGKKLADHQRESLKKAYSGKIPPEVDAALSKLAGDALTGTESQAVVEGITGRFNLARAELVVKQRVLKDLEGGTTKIGPQRDPADVPAGYGVVWEKQILEELRKKGLQDLQEAREGIQLFSTGWLVERDPQEPIPAGKPDSPPTIRHVVLVNEKELSKLRTVLSVLLDKWDAEQLQRSWKEALNVVTGGEVKIEGNDTSAKLIEMHLGISVRDTGVLQLTFDEIQKLKPAELARHKLELEQVLYRVQDVLAQERAKYSIEKAANGKEFVKRQDPTPRPYWWGGDPTRRDISPRAWVERENLP